MKEKKDNFLKRVFRDMAESTKAQHQVDKANLQAAKAEAKATWKEAKLSPKAKEALRQVERDQKIDEAVERTVQANARIALAKELKQK